MSALKHGRHEGFANMVAKGETPAKAYLAIYPKVSRGTASANGGRLLKNAEIAARVQEIAAALREVAVKQGAELIAECPNYFTRIGRAQKLRTELQKLDEVISERAKAYANDPEIPGGGTGLVVVATRGIGTGKNFFTEKVSKVDTELLAEVRATMQQIARELGQWIEKSEMSVKPLEEMTSVELEAAMASMAARWGIPVQILHQAADELTSGRDDQKEVN